MQICFFLIDEHIVVTRQIAQQLQPHFIRGEKATSITGWQLSHWQQFQAYLYGSLGVTTLKNVNFDCFLITEHSSQITYLQQCFTNIKMKSYADLSPSPEVTVLSQYQFFPLQFKLTINEQGYDFLAFINSAFHNKALQKTNNKKDVKQRTETQQPVKGREFIKVKPVYHSISSEALTYNNYYPTTQGVVIAKRGSGFTLLVDGFELFINYWNLRQVAKAEGENYHHYTPEVNTSLMIEITDKELFVLLPNTNKNVEERL